MRAFSFSGPRRLVISGGAIAIGAWFCLPVSPVFGDMIRWREDVSASSVAKSSFPERGLGKYIAVGNDSPNNNFLISFKEVFDFAGEPRDRNCCATVPMLSDLWRKVQVPTCFWGHDRFLIDHRFYGARNFILQLPDFSVNEMLNIQRWRLPLIFSDQLKFEFIGASYNDFSSSNADIGAQLALRRLSVVPYLADYHSNQQDVGNSEHERANSYRIVDKLFEERGYPFIISFIISVACGAIGIALNLKTNAGCLTIAAGIGLIGLAFLNALVPLWVVALYFAGVLQ